MDSAELTKLQKLTAARLVLAKMQQDDQMYLVAVRTFIDESGAGRASAVELVELLTPIIDALANDLAATVFALSMQNGLTKAQAIARTQQRLRLILEGEAA